MKWIAVFLLLMSAGIASAQTNTPTPAPTGTAALTPVPLFRGECRLNLPCGGVPWRMPQFPLLNSPTPIPTINITATASPTATQTPGGIPSATSTPTSAPTDTLVDEALEQFGTIQAIINVATPTISVSGTPVSLDEAFDLDTTEQFFSFVKGFNELNFGTLQPLFNLAFFAISISFTVTIITFVLPLFVRIFFFLVKGIQLVIALIGRAR